MNSHNYCSLGVVEALPEGVPIAASLNQPDKKGQLLVRCLNPSKTPLELRSGVVIGTYTGIEEEEVESPPSVEAMECRTTETEIPRHVEGLYESARKNCSSKSQERQLAELLKKYGPVFSSGEGDVGLTRLVEHSIPVVPGTRPIRQHLPD